MSRWSWLPELLILASLGAPAVLAQSGSPGWDVDVALYGMGAGLDGEAGIGAVTADVDVGFSDVIDNLQLGFFGAVQARKGRLAVMGDLIYAGMGATKAGQGGIVKVDLDSDTWIVEGDAGYALSERVVVFGGARLVDLDNKVVTSREIGACVRCGEVRTGAGAAAATPTRADADVLQRTSKASESWVDPLVGARFEAPLGRHWEVTLRGDVGGFGIGSDLAWNAVATFGYQVSERVRVGFGYRVLDIDYEHGHAVDRFLVDVQMSGPLAGVVLSF